MSNCAFCAQLARVSWLLVNASNNKYSTDRTITGSSPAWDVWKGKNLYNLIPIRNTGSKVKENLFCKRSNKHTRNGSFWVATRLEKRLQDLCNLIALSPGNQMSPFPHIMSFPSHNCHKSDKLLDYLPFAFSPFTFSFFVLLAQRTKPRKPRLCLRSNHSLFLHRNGEQQKEKSASSTKCFWIQPNSHSDIYE